MSGPRYVVERLEAMRWTPADLASVGSIIAWLEIRAHLPTRLGDGIGSRTTLYVSTADGWMPVAPGSWVVFHPLEQYVRVHTDPDYRHHYEEVSHP